MGRKRTKDLDLPPRIQRKGTRYYYVSSGPSRKWIPLGTDLARAKVQRAELEASPPPSLSVGDLVQSYVDREERATSTAVQYRSYHKTLVEAFPIPAAQLRLQHVELWREQNAHRKGYANGCIRLLISAVRLGHKLGLCETFTVGKWNLIGRDRHLLPEEFRAIRHRATDWLQVAMDLAYLTGARPSDIRALRWDQVTGERIAMQKKDTLQRMVFAIGDDLVPVLQQARPRWPPKIPQ